MIKYGDITTLWLSVQIRGMTSAKQAIDQLDYNDDPAKTENDQDVLIAGVKAKADASHDDLIKRAQREITKAFKETEAWLAEHKAEMEKQLASGRRSLTEARREAIAKQVKEWDAYADKVRGAAVKNIMIALPFDATREQQREMVQTWLDQVVSDERPDPGNRTGLAIAVLHRNREERRNSHVHIVVVNPYESEHYAKKRAAERGEATGKKTRVRRERVIQLFAHRDGRRAIRRHWRDHANVHLEKAGIPVRLEVDSYEDLGIERPATKHVGPGRLRAQKEGREVRNPVPMLHNDTIGHLREKIEEVDAQKAYLAEWETSLKALSDEQQATITRADTAEIKVTELTVAVEAERERATTWRAAMVEVAQRVAGAEEERDAARATADTERAAREDADRRRASFEQTLVVLSRAFGCDQDDLWSTMDPPARAEKVKATVEARRKAEIDRLKGDHIEAITNTRLAHEAAMRAKDEALVAAKAEAAAEKQAAAILERQNALLRRQVQTLLRVAEHACRVMSIWMEAAKEQVQTKLAALIEKVTPIKGMLTVDGQTAEAYAVPNDAKEARVALRTHLKTETEDADARINARVEERVRTERELLDLREKTLSRREGDYLTDVQTLQVITDAVLDKQFRFGGDIRRDLLASKRNLRSIEDRALTRMALPIVREERAR